MKYDMRNVRVFVEQRPWAKAISIYAYAEINVDGVWKLATLSPSLEWVEDSRLEAEAARDAFLTLRQQDGEVFAQQLLDGLYGIGLRPSTKIATQQEIVSAKDATIAAKDAHIQDLTTVIAKIIGPALRKDANG